MIAAIAGVIAVVIAASAESVPAIRTTNQARADYLAHAIIWRAPPDVSPAVLLQGPSDAWPDTADANMDQELRCAFADAGAALGGASPKFLCRTSDGRTLRLKYWDPHVHSGTREVFAATAASRLMWALGFNAIPAMTINVQCDGCPENPMQGTGPRRSRKYVAMLQASWPTPSILATDDLDQGWSWRELDTAIRSLPAGIERMRQRTHFDALALFGVLIQHGDRKPEQQRLYCAGQVDPSAGELRNVRERTPMLFERPGTTACHSPAVTIVDVGTTFGGAGRTSNGTTAAMNLAEWRDQPVFRPGSGPECRGRLIDSFTARGDGEPNPIISEEGRQFLLEQLSRLTRDHVRAIFTAARVGLLDRQDRSSPGEDTLNAWVAAFEDKVRQIEAARCQPIERSTN